MTDELILIFKINMTQIKFDWNGSSLNYFQQQYVARSSKHQGIRFQQQINDLWTKSSSDNEVSKRGDSRGLEQETTIFDHLVFQYFVLRNCLSKTSEVSPILKSKVSNFLALSVAIPCLLSLLSIIVQILQETINNKRYKV